MLPWRGLPLTTLLALLGLFKCPGLAADGGQAVLDSEPEKRPFQPVVPDLDTYSALWNRSVFTCQSSPPPDPAPEAPPAGWAAEFQLSGWVRLNGRLSVYLTRLRNQETVILGENEPEFQDVPQLICLSGEDTILNARAQVALNGQTAWVSMDPNASQQINPPVKDSQPLPASAPAPAPVVAVVEPTTVDSRAARLTGPVLLDASATYQSITSPQQPETSDNYERLKNRREQLIRAFPRQPEP
jgi:hypothetical protein